MSDLGDAPATGNDSVAEHESSKGSAWDRSRFIEDRFGCTVSSPSSSTQQTEQKENQDQVGTSTVDSGSSVTMQSEQNCATAADQQLEQLPPAPPETDPGESAMHTSTYTNAPFFHDMSSSVQQQPPCSNIRDSLDVRFKDDPNKICSETMDIGGESQLTENNQEDYGHVDGGKTYTELCKNSEAFSVNTMKADEGNQDKVRDESDLPRTTTTYPVEQVSKDSEPNHTKNIHQEQSRQLQESDAVVMIEEEYSSSKMWSDYRYDLSTTSVPRLVASTYKEFPTQEENFLRGCKWSPDGNCILTNSNDNRLRVFHPFPLADVDNAIEEINPKVKIKESGQIYDFAWYPKMSVNQPEYCRVASTCTGIPIHLWDTTTGTSVASYRAYDQYDEITAAYSLSFSLDGTKIYAGYNKAVRIFDTDYPVRSCKLVKTFNSQKKDGQTGIISCFAHSPDRNGLYVAGSYSRHIGIYDTACDKLVCLMQGQQGGVTHLMFSPDANKLYSGGRKDAEILCWDMRNMGRILFTALRDVRTNQRIYFDLSQSGQYLVSGSNDGTVAFWDTLRPAEEVNGDMFLQPCSQFQAHKDCVNGVSFNHQYNMIATASGQRHFQNFDNYDSDEESEDSGRTNDKDLWDFSLRVWKIPLLH